MSLAPIIPKKWQAAAEWSLESAKTLTAFVSDVSRALSGGLLLSGNSYADIVVVRFTFGASGPIQNPVIVPTQRVTTTPVGVIPMRLVDVTDVNIVVNTPHLAWQMVGSRVTINRIDAATAAMLITGHVYDLTVYVVGG